MGLRVSKLVIWKFVYSVNPIKSSKMVLPKTENNNITARIAVKGLLISILTKPVFKI